MGSKLAELKRTGSKVAAESVGYRPIGIFPGEIAPATTPAETARPMRGVKPLKDAVRIDLDRIIPDPDQPRKTFDQAELQRLGESLLLHGQIHPIVVRWSEEMGSYLVYMGERRYRAAKLIGWPNIAAVILNNVEEGLGRVLERQLVENCHRADLNPIEEATALRRLMDQSKITGDQVARLLAVSPGKISKLLKLLELPIGVQAMVAFGNLAPGTAYEVAKSAEPEALADRVVAEGLTRAEVAAIVKPPTSLPVFGVYVNGSGVPNMYVAAVCQKDAEELAQSYVLPGTRFDVHAWLNELPKGERAYSDAALIRHLGEKRRADLPGQTMMPTIRPEVAPFDGDQVPAIRTVVTSTVTNLKVETLDDTKVYDLGQGVIVVIEGPREMLACPESWLEILVKAIDEGRVDARGHVIPRAAQGAPKKGGKR